ncbi:hypothetical protein D3C87_1624770 [compost metagenome]
MRRKHRDRAKSNIGLGNFDFDDFRAFRHNPDYRVMVIGFDDRARQMVLNDHIGRILRRGRVVAEMNANRCLFVGADCENIGKKINTGPRIRKRAGQNDIAHWIFLSRRCLIELWQGAQPAQSQRREAGHQP